MQYKKIYQHFFKSLFLNSMNFINTQVLSQVIEKSKFDHVTNVDLGLQYLIIEHIKSEFPDDNIISEELTFPINNSDIYWIVDPLDGTANFINSIPIISLSVAIMKKNEIIAGMVIDFNRDNYYHAYKNEGAFFGKKRIRNNPSSNQNKGSYLIGLSTGLLNYLSVLENNEISKLIFKHGKFRILGSQALHLCYVAENKLKFAINLESKVWDDAAGSLVVRESGSCYYSNKFNYALNTMLDDKSINLNSFAFNDKLLSENDVKAIKLILEDVQ